MGIDGTTLIKDGWFMEKGSMWPGQAMSLEVDQVLHHSKSDYQDVLVFKSKTYGNVLVLDGVIQCTQRDEFAYQEMIAHLPLFSHRNPRDVLIVGGGDGGVIREVLKHDSVRKVVLCDIDSRVTKVSREFLPYMSSALDDPRVTVLHDDGIKYIEGLEEASLDVIITDSSDPIGPAQVLFEPPYFRAMSRVLRPDGVLATQGECMWLHVDLISPLMTACRSMFQRVEYAYTTIPTYPSGQIGFIMCAKDATTALREPARQPSVETQNLLRYYNVDIHRAAFVLPQFAKLALAADDSAGEVTK